MDLRSLGGREINGFLKGLRSARDLSAGNELDAFFCQILRKANEFVPSEAGSILLVDSSDSGAGDGEPKLVFVASFGEKAPELIGRRIPASDGIAGQAFRSGKSYFSREVSTDSFFAREFASGLGFTASSIICVPIRHDAEVLGVMELVNRREVKRYNDAELGLLEIFAGYISTSIRNILDARLFNEMARRDDLTGLHNDRWIHRRLAEEIESARRDGSDLSVVFLDLDNFKSVNDRYGHLAGSRTIHEMGRLMAEVIDLAGATLARYGGDEFVALLPGAGPESALETAEKLRARIAGFVFLERPSPGVAAHAIADCITASIGVQSLSRLAPNPPEGSKDRLLKEADAAMYRSKSLGKNRTSLYAEPD
ncbi:MAG: diguanylate cyclase [Myxococcota bacterium]